MSVCRAMLRVFLAGCLLVLSAAALAQEWPRKSLTLVAVFADAEFRERELTGKGYTGVGSTPEEFAAFIRTDLEYKGRLIRVSGAKAE